MLLVDAASACRDPDGLDAEVSECLNDHGRGGVGAAVYALT
jgi:hypothetical protein